MREQLKLAIWRHKEKTKESQARIGLRAGMFESRLSMIIHGRIDPTPEERALWPGCWESMRDIFLLRDASGTGQ